MIHIMVIWSLFSMVLSNPFAKKLLEDLFYGYNKFSRPVPNTTVPVEIKFRLKLAQILDVHEKNQIMTCIVWMQHEWTDTTLRWNPVDFGGVSTLYVPASMLWLPDVVLFNNADGNYRVSDSTKAILDSSGRVTWSPPAIFKSTCPIDVTWFPFDRQICELRFGSWNYDLSELDINHRVAPDLIEDFLEKDTRGNVQQIKTVSIGIDLSDYYQSVEWDVMAVPGKRRTGYYATNPSAHPGFVEIAYDIELRRKLGFYTVNFLVPCIGISLLILLTFYLPCQSREKVSLSISILISLTVFFLLLVEIIPSTSLVLPLFGRYLTFTMILVTLSCMSTVFAINFHFRHPSAIHMPKWIHWLFVEFLPPYLGMERPVQFSHEPLGRQKKFKKGTLFKTARSKMSTSRFSYNWEEIPLHTFTQSHNKYKCDEIPATVFTNHYLAEPEELDDPSTHPVTFTDLEPLLFIDEHFKRKQFEEQIQLTWHYVSNVIDRVFLYCYGLVSFVGTLFILLQAPSVYDTQKPIA